MQWIRTNKIRTVEQRVAKESRVEAGITLDEPKVYR